MMRCPKCSREVAEGEAICPGCEFILDTSFLGDDILNTLTEAAPSDPDYGGDALLVGDPSEEAEDVFSDVTGSFLSAPSVAVMRKVVAAPMYLSMGMEGLLKPDTVLELAADVDPTHLLLAPFEAHVVSFIDGRRPVARIRKLSGLSLDDLRIALVMLAEKKIIRVKGAARLGQSQIDTDPGAEAASADEFDIPTQLDLKQVQGDARSAGRGSRRDPIPPRESLTPSTGERSPDAYGEEEPTTPQQSSGDLPQDDEPAADPRGFEPADAQLDVSRHRAAEAYQQALVEMQAGQLGSAYASARLAATYAPDDPKINDLLNNWHHISADYSRPRQAQDVVLFIEAQRAEAKGQYDQAIALLRKAIELKPGAAALHNRLGVMLSARLKDFDAAVVELAKAVELEPQNLAYRNNLLKVIPLIKESSADSWSDDSIVGHILKRFG